jgi:Fic family protein
MARFQPNAPYNDLPPLPPAQDVETRDVLRQCASARAALGELKQASELIPNPAMLVNTIPVLEAKDSSEIENIVTTADKLFQHAQISERHADPATKEALNYRTALYEGFLSLERRPLSTSTAVAVCSTIKATAMEIRRVPGTKVVNRTTGEVIYTPPEGAERIREKLADWERFLHDDSPLDPVIRMAVAHYQFEAIHPFTDGNGRTGRVINILYLVERDLLTLPILYLSRYVIRNRSRYYQLLRGVTAGNAWEPWLLYILEAVETTATWTRAKISEIRELMGETIEIVRGQEGKIYSRELVEVLFTQPYCRIENVVDAGIAKRQTASEYLKKLCEIGVLKERVVGRDKLFINIRLARMLTESGPS